MTRTERATSPRAIIKDRSESKTGTDKRMPKGGAGTHNWGSLTDERELEEAAEYDEQRELDAEGGLEVFLAGAIQAVGEQGGRAGRRGCHGVVGAIQSDFAGHQGPVSATLCGCSISSGQDASVTRCAGLRLSRTQSGHLRPMDCRRRAHFHALGAPRASHEQ